MGRAVEKGPAEDDLNERIFGAFADLSEMTERAVNDLLR